MNARLELLKQIKAVAYLEGDFTTRAGKKTTYYIDKYQFETRPELLGPLGDAIAALLPAANTYDRLAAPELGAVSLATVVSLKAGKPFVIVKKQSKDYGTQKLIEGSFKKGEKMVLIEDILTTGGAVLRAADILIAEGIQIVDIIGVINREEGAMENIRQKGLTAKAVFTTTDLKTC